MTIESILEQWEWSGYTPQAKDMPLYVLDKIAVKLFSNTPATGDKGMQDEILVDIFEYLTIRQLYNLGFLPDSWVEEEFGNQEKLGDSYAQDYKEFNE